MFFAHALNCSLRRVKKKMMGFLFIYFIGRIEDLQHCISVMFTAECTSYAYTWNHSPPPIHYYRTLGNPPCITQ